MTQMNLLNILKSEYIHLRAQKQVVLIFPICLGDILNHFYWSVSILELNNILNMMMENLLKNLYASS